MRYSNRLLLRRVSFSVIEKLLVMRRTLSFNTELETNHVEKKHASTMKTYYQVEKIGPPIRKNSIGRKSSSKPK